MNSRTQILRTAGYLVVLMSGSTLLACGSNPASDAGLDGSSSEHDASVDGGRSFGGPCPFDLGPGDCETRSGCAYAWPCRVPTLVEAGCVEIRVCRSDAECSEGLSCQTFSVDACSPDDSGCLPSCTSIPTCIPPEVVR